MQILKNVSLKPYNTFGINVSAKYFTKFASINELNQLFTDEKLNKETKLVIGGGSNILFTNDYNGLVIKNELMGIEVVSEDDKYVYIRAYAGENWHRFVLYCVDRNYGGIENLSLIPGNVGASPMQNIGAYGVEIKDVFYELEAYNIRDKNFEVFSVADCEFGYRDSIFKSKYKDQYVITSVTFKLNKQLKFNVQYGAIQQELDAMGLRQLSIGAISQAVINIRRSKLPDPEVIGNAGSFFKNPTIPETHFDGLKNKFSGIVGYSVNDGYIKVAAGWLIEQCGWKGYRDGDAGCHAKQALVLVNYNNASGQEIYDLSTKIIKSIEEKFGILLEREVNVF